MDSFEAVNKEISVFVYIILGITAAIYITYKLWILWKAGMNRKMPTMTVNASVVDLELIAGDPVRTFVNGPEKQWYARITFLTESGERVKLDAPIGKKNPYFVGMQGILTYQGTRFEAFVPEALD